jgi:hypothetical protein
MKKEFIKIVEDRIRISTIKKYSPNGVNKLNVYFNVSRDKIEVAIYSFELKSQRDEMINQLDTIFGV